MKEIKPQLILVPAHLLHWEELYKCWAANRSNSHWWTIMKLFPLLSFPTPSLYLLSSWVHLSLLLNFLPFFFILQHLAFINSSADFFSAITLRQMTSCIYQSILLSSHVGLIYPSSLHSSLCLSRCLSLRSTTNVWPSCSTLYYSVLCVSHRHQTCMPDMMHWLCLIIEMLNKYLQMVDPSSPSQAHKCD